MSEWMRQSFQTPYDLTTDHPFDLAIIKESDSVHYAYMKSHHIVSDAWGLHLFMSQVRADYAHTVRTGKPAQLTAPSFVRQVEEDARYRASHRHEEDLAFFRDALAGVEPALFPRRFPSGARRTRRHAFTLERSLITESKKRGESPFTLFSAAVALYLSRIHRTDEVVLGIPLLNRAGKETKQTVGEFANTLPLRVNTAAGQSVTDLLAQLRDATRTLLRHQRAPLGEVVRALRDSGQRTQQPFDTTISYLRWPTAPELPGVSYETVAQTHAHDQDALAIWVYELDNEADVLVNVEYGDDVFDADFPIEAAARHIETLLRGALHAPETPLDELPMLSAAEHADLTRAKTATDADFPTEATLPDLLADQVARTPQASAIVTAGEELTFAELDKRAERVARALRADGVAPEDRVAVLLERGPHLPAAILGVLRAGAAYVPIDPRQPHERIHLLLTDSGATVVLVDDSTAEVARACTTAATRHVGAPPAVAEPADGPTGSAATAENLAYVIYTSGSTGTPKGVMVEHRSVVNRLWWMQRRYPIGPGDVLLQKTPISFDVSVWELLWWTFTGACLAVPPPGAERDPRELLAAIARHRVTVAHFVPSMLGPFVELLESDPHARRDAASLRLVVCSGEALSPSQVARFRRVFGGAVQLANLYGPTEATVDVTAFDCPDAPLDRVPIGRPIDNTQVYVLGRHSEPQPVGAPGELCVGGVGVARGYLNRPELTAQRFVATPVEPGGRLYRTGDLARWLADGDLEYLGRLDEQVKIRGNRVEPGEVSNHLAAVPGVRDAVVVDRVDADRGTHLVGYYVAEAELDPVLLRDELAARLPDFMVPAYFVAVAAIPLTPNGKTDRRALPEPRVGGEAGRAPHGAVEEGLAAVWAQVLGVESVSAHDDYFALGGDSILMLRLRALAAERGLSFTLADLMAAPTVAALAQRVRVRAFAVDATPRPFELVSDVDRPRLAWAVDAYPVPRLSLGLLYHSDQPHESSLYHDVFRYTLALAPQWDEAALRRAFATLVRRHPVLRSSIDLAGYSEPLQVVHHEVTGGLEVVDLRSSTPEAAEERVREHVEQRRFHHYVFERAPLYLFRVHLRPSSVDLVFSFHHAILDGWSAATLVLELVWGYLHETGAEVEPAPTAALPTGAGHVRQERRSLASPEDREYWRELLAGAEATRLEGIRPHEPPVEATPTSHRVDVPAELVELVEATARQRALPVKSLLLAAHVLTLYLFAGSDDVTTGLVTHGRPETGEAEQLTGLFLNTVPLRVNVSGPRRWLDVVQAVAQREREGHAHRHHPLSAIQESTGVTLRTAFNHVNLHLLESLHRLSGVRLLDVGVWEETNFDLFVNLIVDPGGGDWYVRVDTDGVTLSPTQAELVGHTYVQVLRRLAQRPEEAVDFGFLAPERGVVPRPEPLVGVLTRIENQMTATPEAPAVALGQQRWSYGELDRVSRAVAANLLGAGAQPGARIGVALDRSPEMVATVLGILRAGLTCVPLDVSYPKERLAVIVADARPFRVITHPHHDHLVGEPAITLHAATVTAEAPEVELPTVALDDIACVLFTSGSSGRPKGVELPHRMWANYVQWQLRVPSGVPGAQTLQFAPLSFDMSFQEIFATLSGGGMLRLVSEEDRLDSTALLRLLDHYRVERVLLPFVALQRLAEASDALGIRPSGLRVIISSGEQLRASEEVRRLCAALPGVLLENQYGPTETHQVAAFTMPEDPARFPNLPPIGTPLDGVEIHVLDAAMRPVPVGVSGEIYLGGDCLARGYLDRPELTQERFPPHPLRPEGRLYRTGDVGRVLPNGAVVWLGRADDQVKVRGFRIEPAEVELAILRQTDAAAGVREAAVVAHRRDGVDAFLTAFLVGDPEAVDLDELANQLRAKLPAPMVPAHFVWLAALPLTPSGKRDDAALRAIPPTERAPAERTPPRDTYEEALVELLGELLGANDLGVHDDFFEVGGTSLTAMRLVVTVEKRYGVNIPLARFIQTPTVAGLAEWLRAGAAVAEFDPLVTLRATGERPPLFLVHPLGGHVLCYLKLARHLPPELPVYALQAAGSEPGSEPLTSMRDIAASYVEAIRRVQPHGPYVLGGWSFGGFVAFEMARQLRAADPDSVDRLIVLDSITTRRGHPVRISDDTLLEFFFWELVWFEHSRTPAEGLSGLAGATLTEKFEFITERAMRAGVLPWGTSQRAVRRLFTLFKANWQALIDYRPDVEAHDMVLLRAEGALPDSLTPMHDAAGTLYQDPANGWRDWTSGRLDVINVPGDHLELMDEPHITVVAKHIADLVHGPHQHDWTRA
ncbi:non-ribosomal peptide synthetase [Salinactinospora qingdaonensis]|uniref:Non-ribosomal peptide synthetase n=1 Tax=Salinactinospora qingdaonensis TaxID=702744 RepID=A0ABP7FDY5_9ACTN